MTVSTRSDLVPNEPIRAAVIASGRSVNGIAHDLELDESRLRRGLGLVGYRKHGRNYPPQTRINYHLAVAVTRAIGLDPVDVDL